MTMFASILLSDAGYIYLEEHAQKGNTVRCHYHAVNFNNIMPTSLQQLRQNMNQSLNLQTTAPYLALAVELWDVFCENGG